MKEKLRSFFVVFFVLGATVLFNQTAAAQAKEQYKGNVISFNGPGLETAFFDLRITGYTSDEQARRYLGILQESGQKQALDAINNQNLGTFSIANGLGRTLNVVRETTVNGQKRIFIVFERWTRFAELRGGYRSLDYPFGVIELYIDPATGKGSGTYIAAARIKFDRDDSSNVEIENFATYPVKLVNVERVGAGR